MPKIHCPQKNGIARLWSDDRAKKQPQDSNRIMGQNTEARYEKSSALCLGFYRDIADMNHYQIATEEKPTPICPICGNIAKEMKTKYGTRSYCCGLWSWDRFPLADAGTHAARQAAHKAFDEIWMSGLCKRARAYALLRAELCLKKGQCHIKLMDEATAKRVPDATKIIADRLKNDQQQGRKT